MKVKKKMNYADGARAANPGVGSHEYDKTRSSRIVLVPGCLIYGARARMGRGRLACAIACAMALLLLPAGCARRSAARNPPPARIGSAESGVASWYGIPYDGRPTASGEIFNMENLTAAHRTLPFQTWVEVTNLSNGRQVNVRITDRGPFARGRIIDLSLAAARELDMVRTGTARVKLKVIAASVNDPRAKALDDPRSGAGEYAVQAGAFSDPSRAEVFRQSLPYSNARVLPRRDGSPLWRVIVGHGLTLQAATALAAEVMKTSGEAIVVKEDATQ